MRVVQQDEYVTSALITQNETEEMGLSNSAEFYHMLSATLYSNERLAVIRETLCNADDAHIDAGIPDTPIQITLNEQYLIIQDFGKGIPHHLFSKIYGTYGESTKKEDADSTGGFGLGSKSPFAYTNHFTVTNIHNGIKAVYNCSKTGMEANGKPGITKILEVPFTEYSGVTVKIAILNPSDVDVFRKYIDLIAFNGEMSILLNGDTQIKSTLNLSKAPFGFVCVSDIDFKKYLPSDFNVKYGGVIYPIPQNEELEQYLLSTRSILKKAGLWSSKLVFQAKPNTISVTPSRESVSNQGITITTLKGLLSRFVEQYNKFSNTNIKSFIDAGFDRITKDTFSKITSKYPTHIPENENWEVPFITSFNTFLDLTIDNNYPSNFYSYFENKRMDKFKELFPEKYKKLKPFFYRNWNQELKPHEIYKLIYKTPISFLQKKTKNYLKNLAIYKPARYQNPSEFIPLGHVNSARFNISSLDLFNGDYPKTVFLVHGLNKLNLSFDARYGSLVYKVRRTNAAIKAARELFKDAPFEVEDLLSPIVYVPKQKDSKKVKEPKKKGVPSLCLENLKTMNGRNLGVFFSQDRRKKLHHTESPQYVLLKKKAGEFEGWSVGFYYCGFGLTYLLENGFKGGFCTSQKQYDSFIKNGVPTYQEFLIKHVCTSILKNKNLKGILVNWFKEANFSFYSKEKDLIQEIYQNPLLVKTLKLPEMPKANYWEDKLLTTFSSINHTVTETENPELFNLLKKTKLYLTTYKVPKKFNNLCQNCKKSTSLVFIDTDVLVANWTKPEALKLIKTIIKGK